MNTWTVNDIYNQVLFITNKNQSGGISASDFFYAWNSEQFSMHEDLLGHWQNRNNGKSGQNTGLILNETIKQKLAIFSIPVIIDIVNGVATKPEDFIYELALRMNATGGTSGSKIDKINPDQIYSVQGSVIDAPSVTNNLYYCTEYEDYYWLLPNNVEGTVSLDYVAACNVVKWGFVYDNEGRQVYNRGLSVQPKWNLNTINEITKRALTSLGVHFKDQDFSQYGKENTATGDAQ